MLRPLLTAIIEYILAIYVLKKGKRYKRIVALMLVLLATYQLGEVIVFATGSNFGLRLSYFATTLLPPLGVLIVQRITKRNYLYLPIQILASIFSLFFLFEAGVFSDYWVGKCCIKVTEYSYALVTPWMIYYLGTLTYTMFLAAYHYMMASSSRVKRDMKLILLGYVSFFVLSVIFTIVFPVFEPTMLASFMCALAIIAAFIFTEIALEEKDESYQKSPFYQIYESLEGIYKRGLPS